MEHELLTPEVDLNMTVLSLFIQYFPLSIGLPLSSRQAAAPLSGLLEFNAFPQKGSANLEFIIYKNNLINK